MSTETDDLALDELTRELRKLYGERTSYHRVWKAVIESDGLGYRVGQRWRGPRANLPRVAETLGLTPCQRAA